jgi:hypothetical protein
MIIAPRNVSRDKRRVHRANPGGMLGGGAWRMSRVSVSEVSVKVLDAVVPVPDGIKAGGFQ